jgi:dTDP-glucose 4,6-dehydratase
VTKNWSLKQDLQNIVDLCEGELRGLSSANIFITGGTGFIGCWMLEAIRHSNLTLKTNIRVSVLTRSIANFKSKAPHLAKYEGFTFIEGDVSSFISPAEKYSHIIHAATDASADLNENNPLQMFDTVLRGTRRALDFAVEKNVKNVLFLSSGAVYGRQPWEIKNVPESWLGGPNCVDARATYAEAKRAAEMLCAIYMKQFGVKVSIARIFALLGPYLSLDIHFAAGNFIRDAMGVKKVVVNGDGLPCRSYLYASDLVVWLFKMLVDKRQLPPLNIGSDESISVGELAKKVSTLVGSGECEILAQPDIGWNPGIYVPDTNLAYKELGVKRTVSLDEAILRTAIWNGWRKNDG